MVCLAPGKGGAAYPEPLRRAIIAKNHPILRSTLFFLCTPDRDGVAAHDSLSVNHRITALLASTSISFLR